MRVLESRTFALVDSDGPTIRIEVFARRSWHNRIIRADTAYPTSDQWDWVEFSGIPAAFRPNHETGSSVSRCTMALRGRRNAGKPTASEGHRTRDAGVCTWKRKSHETRAEEMASLKADDATAPAVHFHASPRLIQSPVECRRHSVPRCRRHSVPRCLTFPGSVQRSLVGSPVFNLSLQQDYSFTLMAVVTVVAILLVGAFYRRAFGMLRPWQWWLLLTLRIAPRDYGQAHPEMGLASDTRALNRQIRVDRSNHFRSAGASMKYRKVLLAIPLSQ